MGFLDGLKDKYFQWEDGYYRFLDGLDEKGIPIYALVDPLDKVVPSFALVLVLLLLLIIVAVWLVVQTFFITKVPLVVKVIDTQESPLPGIPVQLKIGDQTISKQTNAEGKTEAFEVPKDTEITIVVEREGFQRFEKKLRVSSEKTETVVLQPTGLGPPPGPGVGVQRKIRIVDQSGQLITEQVTLSFSCLNASVTAPNSATIQNGEYTVTEPANCNGLIARIVSANFKTIDSQPILASLPNTQTIYLSAKQSEAKKGNLEVKVLEDGNPITDTVHVLLFDSGGSIQITEAETSSGIATFEKLEPNTYTVRTVSTAKYPAVSQSNVVITAGETKSISLTVQQNVQGSIKIKVVQKGTQTNVENALVVLQLNDQEIGRNTTSRDVNEVVFFVSEDKSYTAMVDADGYCLEKRTDLKLNPGRYVVELEPFTAACGGSLVVKVLDQDGKVVQNASVALANEEKAFIGNNSKLTDLNGEAVFDGIPTGTYTAFAFKGTVSGWSDAAFFSKKKGAPKSIDLTVTMQIPNGTIRINAVDSEGNGVPFASVFLMDTALNQIWSGGARPTDGQGVLEIETRADKKLFAIVEKQGYARFVSPEFSILAGTVQEIKAEMLPPITKFEVELQGLYQGNLSAPPKSDSSISLANGQEYVAKFRVKIPSENLPNGSNKASEIGLHIRTGDDTIMERDLLFLKQTNIPQATVVRATSFTRDYPTDSKSITNSDAKWVNSVWKDPQGSVIEADVVVQVKPSAAIGKKLSIWYRGWMKIGGNTTRDPIDQSGATNELYSDAKLASYLVGTGTLCDERFCFEASVLDPETQLVHPIENDSFGAKIKHNYTFSFSLANVSKRDIDSFTNAELRFKNPEETIRLNEYTIFDASAEGSRPITGNANAFELPRIPIGDLSPKRQFSGNISLFSEKGKSGTLVFELVDKDRGEVVFSREIQVIVASDKQLAISVEPSLLVAGIQNTVTFTVTNAQTTEPVQDAVVSIRDRFDTLLLSGKTNSLGKTVIILPGQSPGQSLFGIAEKPDYNSARVELSVDKTIAKVEPKRIGFGLNPKTKPNDTQKIVITNLAQFPLTVHRLKLEGKLYGLIDEEAAANVLAGFEGREIAPGKDLEVPVTLLLSSNASQLTEPADLNAQLVVELTNFGQAWQYPVDTGVSIGLGGEADDPSCFTISRTEWKTSTEGKPVSIRFEIQNNCSVKGLPVALQEVEAKVVWESNPLGNFELVSGKSNATLRSGYFKTILPTLDPEGKEVVDLTFTPNGAVDGQAKATILFQATNPADKAPQVLKAQMETTIDIVNLLDCISISKEELGMTTDQVFAPQTTGFGQIYNKQLFEGEFEDTDFGTQNAALAQFGFGSGTPGPFFNNGAYNGFNPQNFNYGFQPGFTPALGGTGLPNTKPATQKTIQDNKPSSTTGKQIMGVPVPGMPPAGGSATVAQDSFSISTKDCGGPVTVTLDSQLKLSTKELQLKADETSVPIIVHGEENYPGQYGIKISIQGAGAKTTKQIRTLPVIIRSNPFDCIQLNKFEFDIYKGNENQGIDTARVYNYCVDKPVPVLVDKHNLHDALKAGNKAAAMGLMMGLMSQVMNGDLLKKIDDKKKEQANGGESGSGGSGGSGEKSPCGDIPTGAKCEGRKIVYIGGKPIEGIVYKSGNTYFYRNDKKELTEVIYDKEKGYYSEKPKEEPKPPEGDTGGSEASPTASQAITAPITGFQFMYPLPFAQGSQSVERTGNPQIDKQRAKDAEELATLQTIPVMMSTMGGGNNPFSMAFMMYAMGSLQAYQSQEDLRILTIQPDVELGQGTIGLGNLFGIVSDLTGTGTGGPLGQLANLIGGKLNSKLPLNRNAFSLLQPPAVTEEKKFVGVSVAEYRQPTLGPRRDNQALSVETAFIKIQNDDGVTQADRLNPLYAILNVNGVRHKYDPDQAYKKDIPNKLREKGTTAVNAKFHLQFNSFKPDTNAVSLSNELDNCTIGALKGSTGPKAVPRIKLAWSWDAISIDACDSDNKDYIYCDGTQFSISLLRKMDALRQFTTQNAATFECPALVSGETPLEQTLSTISKDVALTKLEKKKKGSDINFLTTIESNNQLQFNSDVTTEIRAIKADGNVGDIVKTCVSSAKVLTSETVGCLVSDLSNGAYLITSSFQSIRNCPTCENNERNNDIIFQKMLIGLDNTPVQCEPISTLRLKDFIEATERAGKSLVYPTGFNKEKIIKLANFEARLMRDGYSNDFRNDFHSFAMSKSFFQTPKFYSEEDGLGEYFINPEHMVFDYFGAPNNPLPQPGTYRVLIDINFSDRQFQWFKGGEPAAKMTVSLEKTKDAKPASPFYSMPFDGSIGTDTGRNGYGLNYELLTPDKAVQLNKNADQTVQLSSIIGSNPAGLIKASLVDDFVTVNNSERGKVMTIDLSTQQLKLAPSLATPVILKVTGTTARDAFAYYTLESDKQPQTSIDHLGQWSGIGATCKDFLGNDMATYSAAPDNSGKDTKCAIIGSSPDTAFGFEWCNKTKNGDVFLETVFYAPPTSGALLHKKAGSNEMVFISPKGKGNQVELSGVNSISNNSPTNPIATVQDVLDLVRQELVCVSGLDNSQRTDFFWNQKPILESQQKERDNALQVCIKG